MGDWNAGDLAMCVQTTRDGACRRGTVYTVEAVLAPLVDLPGLHLVGVPRPSALRGYRVDRFRKVQPYQERFAEQLRRALPTKESVNAP